MPMALTPLRRGAAVGLLLVANSIAASMAVSPVRIELSQKRPTSTITVENQGDTERMYQLEAMSWSQESGQDMYERTSELIAVPPIFSLNAGQKQVIRLGTRRQPSHEEIAFRLFIRELPEQGNAGPVLGNQAVKTLLRVGVPVFLGGEQSFSREEVVFSAERNKNGITAILVRNLNAMHVQVGRMKLANGEEIQAAFYLLPGQARRWPLPVPLAVNGDTLDLAVDTDQGRIVTRASVE